VSRKRLESHEMEMYINIYSVKIDWSYMEYIQVCLDYFALYQKIITFFGDYSLKILEHLLTLKCFIITEISNLSFILEICYLNFTKYVRFQV
jgi:hypothetical protein